MGEADAVFVLRTSLGAVLLFAAATKLTDFRAFGEGLAGYGLLPRALVPAGAVFLVAAETAVGLALVASVAPRPAAAAAAALFSIFGVAVVAVLARGARVPCHCFGGSSSEAISGFTLARAVTLLCLAVALAGMSGGGGFPASGRLVADLTLVAGICVLTQLTSVLPEAWSAFRENAPELAPTSVHRVSYRHRPLTLAPARVSDLQWAETGGNGRHHEEVE